MIATTSFSKEDNTTAQSVHLSSAKFGAIARLESQNNSNEFMKNKMQPEIFNGGQGPFLTSMNRGIFASPGFKGLGAKQEKAKYGGLPPMDDVIYNPEIEKGAKKVNLELILRVNDKLKGLFEVNDRINSFKEYLEMI